MSRSFYSTEARKLASLGYIYRKPSNKTNKKIISLSLDKELKEKGVVFGNKATSFFAIPDDRWDKVYYNNTKKHPMKEKELVHRRDARHWREL